MGAWDIIESLLAEAQRPVDPYQGNFASGRLVYRGTQMRYGELVQLAKHAGEPEDPDTSGGYLDGAFQVDPSVWKGWTNTLDLALAKSSTQAADRGAGKINPDEKDLPRTSPAIAGRTGQMYDVVVVAQTSEGPKGRNVVNVRRVAWVPSNAPSEERMAHLRQLMAAKNVAQPQAHGPQKPSGGTPARTNRPKVECPKCGGTGEIWSTKDQEDIPCPQCRGSGEIEAPGDGPLTRASSPWEDGGKLFGK